MVLIEANSTKVRLICGNMEEKVFMVYGGFIEPRMGVGVIIVAVPLQRGRAPLKTKVFPAISKMLRPWFTTKDRSWYVDGEFGQDLLKSKRVRKFRWANEMLQSI